MEIALAVRGADLLGVDAVQIQQSQHWKRFCSYHCF
jgi:hypothetical protein